MLTVALVAVLAGLVAVWLTFQHKPGWYRPAVLDDAGHRRARAEAVAAADFVSDRMVEGRPFDVVLVDRSVNEWLAALPQTWSDAGRSLPPQFRDPAVRFEDGGVRVGAHYAGGGWRAILSAGLSLNVSEDGRSLHITLQHAHSGSLPVPRSLLTGVLDPLLQSAHMDVHVPPALDAKGQGLARANMQTPPEPRALARADKRTPTAPLSSALRDVDSVDQLFAGVKIRNRFKWFNGRRPFRIDSITITGGELRLRIDPF